MYNLKTYFESPAASASSSARLNIVRTTIQNGTPLPPEKTRVEGTAPLPDRHHQLVLSTPPPPPLAESGAGCCRFARFYETFDFRCSISCFLCSWMKSSTVMFSRKM